MDIYTHMHVNNSIWELSNLKLTDKSIYIEN